MQFSTIKNLGIKLSDMWGRGSGRDDDEKPRNNNEPPEMDKLWRDFNERFGSVFNKQRKESGGSEPPSSGGGGGARRIKKPGPASVILSLIVLAVGLWLLTGTFIVKEGKVGVVLTFGKYSEIKRPGISWRWPSPIQTHEIVNVSQVRTVEVGYRTSVTDKRPREALMLTDDENIVDIQFAVQYRLKNATDWLFNHRSRENMVRQVAETAIREVVGKSKMDFVLYEGRDIIALDVHKLMQKVFDEYKSGIQITNVTMQGVQPPEEVQDAFDDAVKAGQDRERQKNEGQAYANDVVPKARGAASRLRQEAEGYRASVIANAEGDAARFKQVLVEYQRAPAVTRDRMYLETMQEVFERTTKMMIDTRNNNNLLFLPLDKLISQTAGGAGSLETAPVTQSVQTVITKPASTSSQDSASARSRRGR